MSKRDPTDRLVIPQNVSDEAAMHAANFGTADVLLPTQCSLCKELDDAGAHFEASS